MTDINKTTVAFSTTNKRSSDRPTDIEDLSDQWFSKITREKNRLQCPKYNLPLTKEYGPVIVIEQHKPSKQSKTKQYIYIYNIYFCSYVYM